jgi:hypothetical protein
MFDLVLASVAPIATRWVRLAPSTGICWTGRHVGFVPNPDITDATNSKIYTPLIEVAQSTEGWSALAKAARDDPDGLPLHCVCVEAYCVERRRT